MRVHPKKEGISSILIRKQPTILIVAPSGITNLVIRLSMFMPSSKQFKVTGIVADDDAMPKAVI